MKKTILYSLLVAGLLSGCDLDINDNPNNPSDEQISPDLIFPSVQAGIAAAVGGDIHNYSGYFAQYYEQKPEQSQYIEISQYKLTESSQLLDYSYRTIYSSALMDAQQVLNMSKNPADIFATTVLRAFALQVMVDNTNEAPYTEALQGNVISNPKWDNGDIVYKGIIKEMDDAQAKIGGLTSLDSDDMVFGGKVSQWIGLANALRLRMYMRFIDADIEKDSYIEKVKTLVNENNFFTGDAAFKGFSDETKKRNPWYETNAMSGAKGNQCAAYPIVSYYLENDDPRIEYAISKSTANGTYLGQIPGARTKSDEWNGAAKWLNANMSAINYKHSDGNGAVQPVYFFTQANLQFLIAEVKLRFMSDEHGANEAYDKAVKADFEARGMKDEDSSKILDLWDSASTDDEKLNLIYMQKWVAFFCMDHMEAWSELRRTDVPKLTNIAQEQIFKNGETSGYKAGDLIVPCESGLGEELIKRVNYPLNARLYNKNTPKMVSLDTPVWWDKK